MQIDFAKGGGLAPALVQDADNGRVLMLGYMNEQALERTLAERRVTFYSRSKERLWTKGEVSGNYLEVVEVKPDCDADAILVLARPTGPVCHTGAISCFEGAPAWRARDFLSELEEFLYRRKKEAPIGSYTAEMFRAGPKKIAQKVGEEAVELALEAREVDLTAFREEAADLLFHLVLLLVAKDHPLSDVIDLLRKRHSG